jgi:uncharacterized protein YukE
MTDRRPGEWDLLQYDSDPVPYDPQDIRDEAGDYDDVVTTIEDQIASLKRLADPDERLLVGQYADKLQVAAEDLGDHLGKIKSRFDDVAGELRSWAGAVSRARYETSAALTMAKAARDQAAKDAEGKDEDAPAGLPGQVPEELRPAVVKAEAAMSELDRDASRIAENIRNASDDDMKDSKRDKFVTCSAGSPRRSSSRSSSSPDRAVGSCSRPRWVRWRCSGTPCWPSPATDRGSPSPSTPSRC